MPTQNNDRIEELMDDPQASKIERATLHLIAKHEMAMEHMVASLDANTRATTTIADTIDAHIKNEEVFQKEIHAGLRAGRWVSGVAISVITLLMSALFGVVLWAWNDFAVRLARVEAQVAEIPAHGR